MCVREGVREGGGREGAWVREGGRERESSSSLNQSYSSRGKSKSKRDT